MTEVQIHTETIRLDALLKLGGLAPTGGHAKGMIQSGRVLVNGSSGTETGWRPRAKRSSAAAPPYEDSAAGGQPLSQY